MSRYLGEGVLRHVRFSVWKEQGRTAHAKAAVSLAEEEAERLARFPGEPADVPSGRPRAPR